MVADILIVDDEADIRALVQGVLEDEGYGTRLAANSAEAYEAVEARAPDLLVLDIWLQNSEHDGMQILETVKARHPHLPVLMISGHGTIETAVAALKNGAYDFIEKPFKSDRLILMIQRALEAASLRRENRALKERAQGESELIGESSHISTVRQILSRVAVTNSRVLITGEPGTGKNIAARMLHRLSKRSGGPYMTLNCAIMHPDRLEAELFGAEDQGGVRRGVLEEANGGSLLLDEVADMPLETQGKIVRVLQEQRFTRVGGSRPVEVDVRIIASTNRDLHRAMQEGTFRQDLFYRLNVVPLELPPLRERVQDIPALAAHFMSQYSAQSGIPAKIFSQGALAAMQAYEWPGNVRQLINVIEWLMIMGAAGEETIRAEHLPPEIGAIVSEAVRGECGEDLMALPLREAREMFEREYLLSQITRFGGNISKTAQFVGMERSALHRKLKILNILPSDRQDVSANTNKAAAAEARARSAS